MGIFAKPEFKEMNFYLGTAALVYGKAINHQFKKDVTYLRENLTGVIDFWSKQVNDPNVRLLFDLFQPPLVDEQPPPKYSHSEVQEVFKMIDGTPLYEELRTTWLAMLTNNEDRMKLIEVIMEIGGISNDFSENEAEDDLDQSVLGVVLEVLGDCADEYLKGLKRNGKESQNSVDAHGRAIAAMAIGSIFLTLYKKDKKN